MSADILQTIAADIVDHLGPSYTQKDLAIAIDYYVWRHLAAGGTVSSNPYDILGQGAAACGGRTILYSYLGDILGLNTQIVSIYDYAGGSHSAIQVDIGGKFLIFDPLDGGYFTADGDPDSDPLSIAEVLALSPLGQAQQLVPTYQGQPFLGEILGVSNDQFPLPDFYRPGQGLYGINTNDAVAVGLYAGGIANYHGRYYAAMSLQNGVWHSIDWIDGHVNVAAEGVSIGAAQGTFTSLDQIDLPDDLVNIDYSSEFKSRLVFDFTAPGTYQVTITPSLTDRLVYNLFLTPTDGIHVASSSLLGHYGQLVTFSVSVAKAGSVYVEPDQNDDGVVVTLDAIRVDAVDHTLLTLNDGGNNLTLPDGITRVVGGDGFDSVTLPDFGGTYTFSSIEKIVGGIGNDVLVPTSSDQVQLLGGAGDDTYVVAGSGNQVVEAPASGIDSVYASIDYTLPFNVEDLVMTGSAVYGTGNGLDNWIFGNAGDNLIDGGVGADMMIGGNGNDVYVVDSALDVITENPGGGTDTVYVSIDYKLPANVEYAVLIGGAVYGTGNELANIIYGNSGDNVLDGKGDNDILIGGQGNDIFIVDSSGDQVFENPSEGADTVDNYANYALPANVEYMVMQGFNSLYGLGNDLNNWIYGNAAGDVLDGGAGADVMIGGNGNDVYEVDNVGDQVFENPGEGSDYVVSSVNYQMPVNIESLALTGSAVYGNGNSDVNAIYGSTGDNVLDGRGGADGLTGGGGNDTFEFRRGEADGDFITDFQGNGAAAGDWLVFVGYGSAAAGASFVQVDATHWRINSSDGSVHETIQLTNGASVHPSDYFFA